MTKSPSLRILRAMSSRTLPIPPPQEWFPGLQGDYPGQRSFMLLTREVRITFCWCPPTPHGQPARLGSPPDEVGRDGDDQDIHLVPFPQGFWLAQHPVSQVQWQAVMGANPSHFKGDDLPVENVSWEDVQRFGKKTGLHLPTEAMWEYACRAGSSTQFAIGSGSSLNAQLANFDGRSPYGNDPYSFEWLYRVHTTPQGSFPPNTWGLHDMHGQLWEWCEDVLRENIRVLRGASWFSSSEIARSAFRGGDMLDFRGHHIGFRPSIDYIHVRGRH